MIQAINLNLNNVTGGRKNPPKTFSGDFSAPMTMLPEGERNYALFNKDKVEFIASQKERAIPYVKQVLETSQDENEIVEALYITDRLCDNGTKGVAKLYPTLAKFNDTKSANIQTFLAGIYRKTQVPDAFGPLVVMLIRNAMSNEVNGKWKMENGKLLFQEITTNEYPSRAEGSKSRISGEGAIPRFDPNEEIGGAILAYIENYSNHPQKIDYSA